MNNKKNNEGQSDFSYYGLYLMDYLRTNKFEQATDTAFIRERADRAAETYEKARIEGYWKSHATLTLLATQDCPLWLQYD